MGDDTHPTRGGQGTYECSQSRPRAALAGALEVDESPADQASAGSCEHYCAESHRSGER